MFSAVSAFSACSCLLVLAAASDFAAGPPPARASAHAADPRSTRIAFGSCSDLNKPMGPTQPYWPLIESHHPDVWCVCTPPRARPLPHAPALSRRRRPRHLCSLADPPTGPGSATSSTPTRPCFLSGASVNDCPPCCPRAAPPLAQQLSHPPSRLARRPSRALVRRGGAARLAARRGELRRLCVARARRGRVRRPRHGRERCGRRTL